LFVPEFPTVNIMIEIFVFFAGFTHDPGFGVIEIN
jgi:hypothetical protein